MDKYEYQVRLEEIKALTKEQNFKAASEIADTIDWRKVKSVQVLCTVSDVYKMVRRYEDSKALLMLAYNIRPNSKMIVYALAELCLKLKDIVNAWEFVKQFHAIAPDDTRRFILLYKVYVAQEVSLDEQIKILEQLKEEEYLERWAYELAYLYHRVGFATKCVEECDEMILWFGEGKYVRKAMELKMRHQPLTPKQQALYEGAKKQEEQFGETKVIPNLDQAMQKEVGQLDPSLAPTVPFRAEEVEEIQVKTMDNSPYNTINLQAALAESMKEFLDESSEQSAWDGSEEATEEPHVADLPVDTAELMPQEEETAVDDITTYINPADIMSQMRAEMHAGAAAAQVAEAAVEATEEAVAEIAEEMVEEAVQEPPTAVASDMEELTLPGLVGEEAEKEKAPAIGEEVMTPSNMTQVSEEEEAADEVTEALQDSMRDQVLQQIMAPMQQDTMELPHLPDMEEVYFDDPNTMDISDAVKKAAELTETKEEEVIPEAPKGPTYEINSSEKGVKKVIVPTEANSIFRVAQAEAAATGVAAAEAKSGLENILSQESDGQISLVVPESATVEKQITGQMNISDILASWDNWQEQNKEKLKEDIQKRSTDQTQDLFDEFDEKNKHGLLEELQKLSDEAEKAEAQKALDAQEVQEDEEAVEGPGDTTDYSRSLTEEEKELYGPYAQSRKARRQLLHLLDVMSLAAFTGNVLITGDEDSGAMTFVTNIVKGLRASDSNFSGQAAKIAGKAMNKKDPESVVAKLNNGVLIITDAGGMSCSTAEALVKALQNENRGILVILVDTKGAIDSLLDVNACLTDPFNARFDIEALTDDALVAYGRKFAYEREYAIDEMGVLALHTRIADMQTIDHAVTVRDVRVLIKEAIAHAERFTPKHYFALLAGKRYDKEDMIVLREEDFLFNY